MSKDDLLMILMDEPPAFAPVETWEQHLAELQAMPDFLGKDSDIRFAKEMIGQIKKYSTPE